MIARSSFLTTAGMALIVAAGVCGAQTSVRIPRIGYMHPHLGAPHTKARLEAFRQGLRELGYVEGKTILIESRSADGNDARVPTVVSELVRMKVDIIVADGGPLPALAAKAATRTIPIVFPVASDPVAAGLVASLARPGGNVTGLSLQSADSVGKRFELIKEIVPGALRIAVVVDPNWPHVQTDLPEARRAAKKLGVELQVVEASTAADLEGAFYAMKRTRVDAIVILQHPMFTAQSPRIAALAAKQKLPTIGGQSTEAENGELASYGPDRLDLLRRAAIYVDKILKGAEPADLPVEQPTKFELVLNLKTAKALGITIPQSILVRADRVIE